MVKKLRVRPTSGDVLGGLQRQARQGIARPSSSLAIQAPHDAPEGESEIPAYDPGQAIEDGIERLEELDAALESARERIAQIRGANLVPNGGGDRGENGGWYGQAGGVWTLEWVEGDAPAGLPGRFVVWPTGAIVNPVVAGVEPVLVEPGQTYLVEAWVHGTEAPGAFPVSLALVTVSGSTLALIPDSTVEVDGLLRPITGTPPASDALVASGWVAPAEWTRIGAHFTAPAGVSEVYVYGLLPGGGAIAGVSVRRALVGEDIVANEVAAAVGVFIDAMMENLTVTGAANISEAAIGELTARVATILTLNAEQIIVGRDARFWDGGLEFYAPPAEGQDPTDWANRIPIISLMPSGDVSISVAQDGEATAGMSADGEVWGHSGAFEELYVRGDSVLDIVDGKTDGITGVALLDGEVNVYTTRRDVLGIRTEMTSGRMYRVDWHAGIAVGTGTFRAYVTSSQPATIYRPMNTVQESGGVTHGAILIPTWTEGETRDVQVKLEALADSGTSIVRTNAWLAVEDKGNAVVPEIVTATNPTPPTQVYTRTFTSQPGVPTRPNGSFAPDGRRMVGGQSQGYGSDMSEHVFYQFSLGALAGSTILDARMSFTVSSTKFSGTPIALRIDATTGYLNGRVNVFNGAFNVGGRSATIPSSLRQQIVGKAGILFSPLYPGNSTQGYGGMGERMTLTVRYRK